MVVTTKAVDVEPVYVAPTGVPLATEFQVVLSVEYCHWYPVVFPVGATEKLLIPPV